MNHARTPDELTVAPQHPLRALLIPTAGSGAHASLERAHQALRTGAVAAATSVADLLDDALLGSAPSAVGATSAPDQADRAAAALDLMTVLASAARLAAVDSALHLAVRDRGQGIGPHPATEWHLAVTTVESICLEVTARAVCRLVPLDPARLRAAAVLLGRLGAALPPRLTPAGSPRSLAPVHAPRHESRAALEAIGAGLHLLPSGEIPPRRPNPRTAAVFDLRVALPDLDLDLLARGRTQRDLPLDPVLADYPETLAVTRIRLRESESEDSEAVIALAELVLRRMRELGDALAEAAAAGHRREDAHALMTRLAFLYAAAAALHLFHHNQRSALFGEPAGSTRWVRATLAYLLAREARERPGTAATEIRPILLTADAAAAAGRSVSLRALPVRVEESGSVSAPASVVPLAAVIATIGAAPTTDSPATTGSPATIDSTAEDVAA